MAIPPLNPALANLLQPGGPNPVASSAATGELLPFDVLLAQLGVTTGQAVGVTGGEVALPETAQDTTQSAGPPDVVNLLVPFALPANLTLPPPAPEAAELAPTLPPTLPLPTSQLDQLRLRSALVPQANAPPASQQPPDATVIPTAPRQPGRPAPVPQAALPTAVPAPAAAPPPVNPAEVPTGGHLVIAPITILNSAAPPIPPQTLAEPPIPVPVTPATPVRLDLSTPTDLRLATAGAGPQARPGPAPAGPEPASTFATALATATPSAQPSTAPGPISADAVPIVPRLASETAAEIRATALPPAPNAPAVAAEPQAVAVPTAPRGTAEPVVQQIAEGFVTHARALASNDRTEFQLQLEPEHLGRVRIHLTATGDEVRGQLFVADDSVRRLIESQLPELRQRLESAGVSIQRFDVSTGSTDSQAGQPWRGGPPQHYEPGAVRQAIAPQRQPEPAPARSANRIDVTV